MSIGDTLSSSQINKKLKKAGYAYGTDAHYNERCRCFRPNGEGEFLQVKEIDPPVVASASIADRKYEHGGFYAGSNDVT